MALAYNPLNETHCAQCTKMLQDNHAAEEVLKACIDCGFPAEELLQHLQRQTKQAADIKRLFFPTHP